LLCKRNRVHSNAKRKSTEEGLPKFSLSIIDLWKHQQVRTNSKRSTASKKKVKMPGELGNVVPVPFCCVCVKARVCSTAWDGARWLCALVRCLQKLHHEELQKSGCQRSATGKANDVPFTAKPNAGSQETIEVKCLSGNWSVTNVFLTCGNCTW